MKRLLFLAGAICLMLIATPAVPACGLNGTSALQLNQQMYYQQPQLQLAPQYVMPQLDLPACPTLGLSAQSYGAMQQLQRAPVQSAPVQSAPVQQYQSYGSGVQLQLGQQLGYGAGLQLDMGAGVGYGQNGVLLDSRGLTVDPVTGLVIDDGGGRGHHRRGNGIGRGGRGRGRGHGVGNGRGRGRGRSSGTRTRSRSRTRTRTRSR